MALIYSCEIYIICVKKKTSCPRAIELGRAHFWSQSHFSTIYIPFMKMILAIRSNMSLCKFDGYGVRVIFYIKIYLIVKRKGHTYILTRGITIVCPFTIAKKLLWLWRRTWLCPSFMTVHTAFKNSIKLL